MKTSILVATATLLGISSQAQASNLIQNGSFETPVMNHGQFNYYGGGQAAPWTGSFQVQNAQGPSNAFCDQACPSGIDRAQFAVLQGGSQYASQTFVTAKAPGLRVSWKDAGRTGYSRTDTYSVFFDGVLAGNYTGGEGAFAKRTLLFSNLTAGAHTLRFQAVGDRDDSGLSPFIDHVSAASVPEPASWAMLITGFGLTGATLRRRRVATLTA